MKNLLFFVSIIACISSMGQGQPKTDSLETALKTAEGAFKVKTYNELFRAWNNSNPVKAIEYASLALALATEIDDKKGMAAAYNNIGVSYRNQGALDKALEYYMNSLSIYESIQNKEGIATSKNNIGNIYSFKKDYEQATKYLEESHQSFVELNDKVKLVGSLNNLGNLNNDLQLFDKALIYYTDSYRLSDSLGMPFSDPLNNIGNLYFKKGDFQEAGIYFMKALELAKKNQNLLTQLNVYASLGEVNTMTSQYKKSEIYLDSALQLVNQLEAHIYEPTILKSLANNYAKQGKTREAYEYMVRFDASREKVFSEESSRKIAQMGIALDLHTKEKELESSKAETQIKSLELQKTRMIITLVILSIAVLVGGINLFYSKRRTIKIK
jgi:tetratricopeptide (TPR) repeat protein